MAATPLKGNIEMVRGPSRREEVYDPPHYP